MRHRETHSIQIWPSGRGFEYRGDPYGPADRRELRSRSSDDTPAFRPGNSDEWRQIRIALRAELYQRNLIHRCDSALITDLIEAAMSGDMRAGDLRDGFSYDEIRNMRPDPSEWDAEKCRDWLSDKGIDQPDKPVIPCDECDGSGSIVDDQESVPCTTCNGNGTVTDPDADDDDTYLSELRDAITENAEDAEVFEWWSVDSWLCGQLHAIGEVTIDNGYGNWWGRTGTGQGLIMDGTLQEIAALYEAKIEDISAAEANTIKP